MMIVKQELFLVTDNCIVQSYFLNVWMLNIIRLCYTDIHRIFKFQFDVYVKFICGT
jgi:hypothetical protein